MNNKDALEKLIKIVANRQPILVKLAQELSAITDQVSNFIKKNTTLWLANNQVSVKYQFSFEEGADPGFDYTLDVKFVPAGPKDLPDVSYMNLPAKYKEYIVSQLSTYPPLKDKKIKVDVQMVPTF